MSAFTQLCEPLQYGIVHTLRWRELRPVQELCIEAILAGQDAVVLAPTAGGKTEAAMFPILHTLHADGAAGLGALYLSPLRALLNNQEPRLRSLAAMAGMDAFKWHGDVGPSHKKRFLAEPCEVLMITPESLEVILMTPRYDKEALFGRLRFVVVDEIHAFAGDDRGAHLIALLERLTEFAGTEFQRLGLSATVGDPKQLLNWLQGSSRRPGVVVRPPSERSPRILNVLPLEPDEEPAARGARLLQGKKSLFFAESRRQVEAIKQGLEEAGVAAFAHHGSLSRELREESERAFRSGSNCSIVCTSTMELGLDVGDLDLVAQLDAPATVSAFLQRLGRTGRRPGTRGTMVFLTQNEDSFLQACGLLSLALKGYVEPIEPSARAVTVFLHQLLARTLAHSGLGRSRLLAFPGRPFCFGELGDEERSAILDHLLELDILAQAGAVITMGRAGEKAFGGQNFRALYAVFDSPAQLVVRTDKNQEIGNLDAWFVQTQGEPFVFSLGGRSWESVYCDWSRGVLTVKPARRGRPARWLGGPRLLSRDLCEAMRDLLLGSEEPPFLTQPGQAALARLRRQWGELLRPARLIIVCFGNDSTLFTFAGARINQVLARVLQRETGLVAQVDNRRLAFSRPDDGSPSQPWLTVLERLRQAGYFTPEVVEEMVAGLPRGRLSKFQPYLPPRVEARFLAERLFDLGGAVQLAGEPVHVVL